MSFGSQLPPVIDTKECMRKHGISVPRVFISLRRFGLERDDVKKIVLGSYSGKSYSIAVLIDGLTMEKMTGVVKGLSKITGEFNGEKVLIYPLGIDKKDSYLFRTYGFYVVYPDEGRI